MNSPSGSSDNLVGRITPKARILIIVLALVVLAIILVIISIVRNELRVVQLSQQESAMLRKICEATVSGC